MQNIRKAAVANFFYPDSKAELESMINGMLKQKEINNEESDINNLRPKAIISPHAGFIYSGEIAASAYSLLQNIEFSRVLLLGPTHRVPFYGLALSSADYFQTPLGEIAIDKETTKILSSHPEFSINDHAHLQEHSLETQLPFLQKVSKKPFKIIPILVSDCNYINAANSLIPIMEDKDTITVVSSDLSHFHDYEFANKIDKNTSNKIVSLSNDPIIGEEACGCHAINILLEVSRRLQWNATEIEIKNSGDTAGTDDKVVGYGAYSFE